MLIANTSQRIFSKFFQTIVLLLLGLLILHCGKKEESAANETIVARIGDKSISVNEFIRRAEYTIRPAYCRGDDYIHKKIVLNALIAEKLLALEAGEENELTRTEEFQLYLQGRQEQAMRQWLYYKDVFATVALDTNEVKMVCEAAGRKYKVAYYTIKDSRIAELVEQQLQEEGKSFEEVFHATGSLEGIPQREVAWDSPLHSLIHQALFSEVLKKDRIIGPLKIEDEDYVVMKVLGWTEQLAITDTQIQRRWQDVTERLTHQRAAAIFDKYVVDLMRGKRVEFAPQTFRKLVHIVGPYYMKSFEEKREVLNQQFWNSAEGENMLDKMGNDIEAILDEPLFRMDDEIRTVRDWEREIKIHPLVFRKKRLKKSEFAEQFKLAIVDMVSDRYLAQDAYQKGYDRVEAVKRNVEMWKDNLLFLYQQNTLLQTTGKQAGFNKDYMAVVEEDLTPYIDSLQTKYQNVIEINTAAFEKIKLTVVDMMVIQQNVPFPVVVPGFPVVTIDHLLDYGRRMR